MSLATENPFHLDRTVIPAHYDLEIKPDLEEATFQGSESIRLTVRAPVDQIVLNAIELEIGGAWVERFGGVHVEVTKVQYDEKTERATLHLAERLQPGEYTLSMRFSGILNDKLHGFYRSTFKDEAGQEHVIATTHFESTDARRAFPCFDEPDLKATFGITLVVPEDLFAISNGPVISDEKSGDGHRIVRFADTMVMSTYLVAYIVGPFEATAPVDVDGVPLRVVHPIGKGHLASYALEVGAFSLRFFADYYAIPYPGQKLDLVALPDFAMGAMENLGCVTFREALLLLDPERVTQGELSRVAEVVAHELAHMWFGDLVTMRWWNGIWLNEAFATFMANAAVDAYKPEWKRWVEFALDRSAALDVDALETTRPIEYPVESPDDAEGMFDVLTYEKGASVLRMLEQYLGEDRYRDGIRHYLRRHQYGNTETNDLWDAIEEVTGEPARRIMDSWIFQGGFPLITVTPGNDDTRLSLSQRRFRYVDDPEGEQSRWSTPVIARAGGDGNDQERRALLEEGRTSLQFEQSPDFVIVNAGGHGFYRVRYEEKLLQALAGRMFIELEPVERYGLLDDTWAAVLAGHTEGPQFLSFVEGFEKESDVDVWSLLSTALAQLSRTVDGKDLESFRELVRKLANPALQRMGWEPREGESKRDRQLRSTLIRLVAVLGQDEEALGQARTLHDRYLADTGTVEPNVAAAVASAVASVGTSDDFDVFVGRYRSPATPQEEVRYLHALSGFPGKPEIQRTLEMAIDSSVRTQNAPFLVGQCIANRYQGELAWRFVRDRWKELNDRYPSNTIPRMLGGLRALNRSEVTNDVLAFFEEHDVPQGRLMLKQHLEKMRVNVALREREKEKLAAYLRG